MGITDWGIVTDEDLPKNFISNIGWLHDAKILSNRPNINLELIVKLEPILYKAIKTEEMDLANLALKYDEILGLEFGSCLFIVKHLLANKIWEVDIENKLINPSKKIEILNKKVISGSEFMGGIS